MRSLTSIQTYNVLKGSRQQFVPKTEEDLYSMPTTDIVIQFLLTKSHIQKKVYKPFADLGLQIMGANKTDSKPKRIMLIEERLVHWGKRQLQLRELKT